MIRADFLREHARLAERATKIGQLKYLLDLEPDVDYEARDAIGFTAEGAIMVAVEPRQWEEGDEAVRIVIPWEELEDPDAIPELERQVAAKKERDARANEAWKREQFERLRRELGEG